ncbi:coiled-coil domain-containing protein 74A isoform X2 [Synchiropus splendidus]|uniref:coiled-coil domain-containing protein 74A isoform X2 n=1 Tax=Synchiropus splendidus TaxID=270530 RepID=UPI00237E43E5|nr:coiled-coil domain-containing protein 74A isoform X2 [Synchiropus splendidus]
MSSRDLPPVRHLPHWTRVGGLGSTSLPQRLPANRLQPLCGDQHVDGGRTKGAVTPGSSDSDPRVASLRRNIEFLQTQHKDTLEKLHGEVDYLRRQNKELQYRLIMEHPKSSVKETRRSQTSARSPAQGTENSARSHLVESIMDARLQGQQLSARVGGISSTQDQGSPSMDGLITSLQPLRIHRSPSRQPHAPTLPECEAIIRQLYKTNCLQSQEIARVKNLLREIVLNRRVTPEHHLLTKAYVGNSRRKLFEDKKPGPQALSEKLNEGEQSRLILPVLTRSVNCTTEKQRRARAVQRDRSKASHHETFLSQGSRGSSAGIPGQLRERVLGLP